MTNKYTVKRVGKPDPYMPYEWRCKFAVETFRSAYQATADEQVTELELMLGETHAT